MAREILNSARAERSGLTECIHAAGRGLEDCSAGQAPRYLHPLVRLGKGHPSAGARAHDLLDLRKMGVATCIFEMKNPSLKGAGPKPLMRSGPANLQRGLLGQPRLLHILRCDAEARRKASSTMTLNGGCASAMQHKRAKEVCNSQPPPSRPPRPSPGAYATP